MRRIAWTLLLVLIGSPLSGATLKLTSPDGKIEFSLLRQDGQACYQIRFSGRVLVTPSAIGFEFADGCLGPDAVWGKASRTDGVEVYDLPVGKASHVRSPYREMTVPLRNRSERDPRVELVVRAFNDGVAFRYVFPEQAGKDSLLVAGERMDLNLAGNPTATVLPLWGFQNSHEGEYWVSAAEALPQQRLFDLPATFEFPTGEVLSVTEAAMSDYPGMLLYREDGILGGRLSPRLDRPDLCVVSALPHRSPWRVFMISDYVGDLIASTILTSLADPCKVEDTSWLKPGQTTFPWWCDSACADSTFQWGNNFRTNAYYVDFAAANGIEYHSVYGYADTPWYYDDGPAFSHAGPGADITRPAHTLDFARLCKYAQSKGIDIHVWLNWKALWKDIDHVFDQFNEWGVKGMMVDFLDRDDQEMIVIQETILRKAAEHRLFIQFHGASKPSGLVRTWPNEFTREGALNYEFFKGDSRLRVGGDHDLHIPFTRLLAGPVDFHLGGFSAVPRSEFRFHNHEPFVTVTRCHMIAMYVVLESYLSMVCDSPRHYLGAPGFDFLAAIPTSWDETRVPVARINEYVAIARRKGSDWWLGAITGLQERDLELDLSFLGPGTWEAVILTDAPDVAADPNQLVQARRILTSADRLTLHLGPEGGAAIHFRHL